MHNFPPALELPEFMRIGLIADIHGDMRALETSLRRLEDLAVDRTLCLGDLVGYGSQLRNFGPGDELRRSGDGFFVKLSWLFRL